MTYLQDLITVAIFAQNLILLFQVYVLFTMIKTLSHTALSLYLEYSTRVHKSFLNFRHNQRQNPKMEAHQLAMLLLERIFTKSRYNKSDPSQCFYLRFNIFAYDVA